MVYDATIIEENKKEIDQLKETIQKIQQEIRRPTPKPNYDAGNGLVYMNPNEQFENDLNNVHIESAMTDRRVCKVELLLDTLIERVSSLEQKTESMMKITTKKKGK